MARKTLVALAVVVALASVATMLLARPSRAAKRKYIVADVTYTTSPVPGAREEAKKLGLGFLFRNCGVAGAPGACTLDLNIKLYKSLIAQHVDAMVADGFNPELKRIFSKVRKAGILLISSGDDIAAKRDLYVSYGDPATYAEALADALASQVGKKGEYAILEEGDEFPIATDWGKIVQAYVPKAYPKMKLDGVVVGTGAGDQTEVNSVKAFIAAHPHLKGLIGITPTEADMAAEGITQSGLIGQIFSAGNGDDQLGGQGGPAQFVRNGSAELVYGGYPRDLGYLTVWGAHYLLTGHHFRTGRYEVGGPIGPVYYYAKNRELRLGHPLTITKANVDFYASKF